MSCAKLKLMFVIVFWFSALISLGCAWESSGDAMPSPTACLNCTICPYPCHPLPPPDSGTPSYGAPPPPSLPGYATYAPPPPPPPSLPGYPQGKCPPTPGVQCCQYIPPAPPYQYVPYGNHAHSFPMPIFLNVVMILLFFSAVLF